MIATPAGDDGVARLRDAYARTGARGALQFLNSLTAHRFTSMYCFDNHTLHAVTFYDRENPELDSCDDIPVMASYCVFVRDSGAPIRIENSRGDERTRGHAKRDVVQRYCGVPLFDLDGRMFGTICHFDLEPGPISNAEVDMLERMARLVEKTPATSPQSEAKPPARQPR